MTSVVRSSTSIRLALAIAFLLTVALQASFDAGVLRVLRYPEATVELPFNAPLFNARVAGASSEAVAAGLRDGDVLREVEGVPLSGRAVLVQALAGKRPGDVLGLAVARDGALSRLAVPLLRPYSQPFHAGRWMFSLLVDIAFPIFCLLLGFGVAAIRPRDPLAYVLLWLLVSFSRIADSGTAIPLEASNGVWNSGFDALLIQSWTAGMFLFGVLFPDRLESDRRRPWAKWLLLGPLLAIAVLQALRSGLASASYAAAEPFDQAWGALGRAPLLLGMLGIGLFFRNIGYKWGTATSPDGQRRLRLLITGAVISLTPPFLLAVWSLIQGGKSFGSQAPTWALVGVLACLTFFPLTLAYVIVVERAMDVRVVIRQGLQYAFARNGILAVRFLVIAVAALLAIAAIADPSRTLPSKIAPVAAGLLLSLLVGRAARALQGWTDRRFFREAYDAERILGELSDRVRSMLETAPLLETVTQTISESLHVPGVGVLLAQAGGELVAEPGSTATARSLRLEAGDALVERLRRGEVVRDRSSLEPLGLELLLPLAVKEKLLGGLSLGPKLSEQPYSASDVRLLRSVAAQTSLAIENSRLTEAIASEVARRERLNREVEIAHEVQEQLFPQSYPERPGLDLAGYCRPARGVGGDYYDFISLPDGRLGIAIGDISGKGIPAALLMAGLQAGLRSQTLAAPDDLTLLMRNLNRLTCESSPSNRYATFFYSEYDPKTRELVYVNAGHNAPMLFRVGAAPSAAIRLEAGGPVIGLLEIASFEQASLRLEPGDVLLGFTDGISEAMNAADEEWGEERLAEAAGACDGLPAREVITRLMEGADAFAAGAEQHDDMTLIVVRIGAQDEAGSSSASPTAK